MNDIPVTILILTRNEEKAISGCLDSLRRFMQIIVVDSNSTDLTSHISRLHGAEVVGFDWNGKYPKKKQWSMLLPQIKFDWILFVDADERVSENLADEIQSVINGSEHTRFTAYEIPLEYHFLGKRMLFGHQVKKIALINRHHSWFPVIEDLHIGNMWEVEGHYQPCTSGSVGKLSEKIIHQDPDPLYDYFARHNRYSDWEAELRMNPAMQLSVRKVRTPQGALFDKIPGKPILFFLYSYILKSGWRDGRVGFNYALSLSFYYWQISAKVLEKRHHA